MRDVFKENCRGGNAVDSTIFPTEKQVTFLLQCKPAYSRISLAQGLLGMSMLFLDGSAYLHFFCSMCPGFTYCILPEELN